MEQTNKPSEYAVSEQMLVEYAECGVEIPPVPCRGSPVLCILFPKFWFCVWFPQAQIKSLWGTAYDEMHLPLPTILLKVALIYFFLLQLYLLSAC